MRLVPLCMLLPVVLTGCEQKVKPAVSAAMVASDFPSQEIWGFTVAFSDSNRDVATIRADHAATRTQTTGGEVTTLDGHVQVDFYDAAGRHQSTLRSRRATVEPATRNLAAYEQVVVTSDDGKTLETEELHWRDDTQRVFSDRFVTLTTPTQILRGTGFESDQQLRNYVVRRPTGQATVAPGATDGL